MKITQCVQIDSTKIIDSLVEEWDHEQISNFVKELDRTVADWGFTKGLYEYFKKEMEKYPEEAIGLDDERI